MLLRSYLQEKYGVARRLIISLIDEGVVFLNGQKVENYKQEVQFWDLLSINRLKIDEKIPKEEKKSDPQESDFLLFNKPIGYTCSKADPHNQTFYDLLPPEFRQRYYYIGRLDKESRGLVLLARDPKIVHEFEHPSKEITKEYHVLLNKPFNRSLQDRLLKGVSHQWELLRALKLYPQGTKHIWVILNEGKKRHIRRMFKVLGYEVIDLKRVRIGTFYLGELPEGKRVSAQKK